MALHEAMSALGVTRVVWIDDLFTRRPHDLASLVLDHPEMVAQVEELSEFLEGLAFDPEGAEGRLRQIIARLSPLRREQILDLVLAGESAEPAFETPELSGDVVHQACKLLNVADEDRLSFQDAPERLSELVEADDTGVGYIIDLNEAGGSDIRGLEMLQILWQDLSRGVPLILTHAAKSDTEGEKEAEFRDRIAGETGTPNGIPVAVIAKERLPTDADDSAGIEKAFEIAWKRAGLRRAIHVVLDRAHSQMTGAYATATSALLRIAPEQLDSYVVERGYVEGVSEFHVIERALAAQASHTLRSFFASDPVVRENLDMIRALRPIALDVGTPKVSPELADFRKAEVWDSSEIVNSGYSPIACGDVFEVDQDEQATRGVRRKFVLLGQPCDIAIRSDGKRVQAAGILVPITNSPDDVQGTQKAPLLPFRLEGSRWRYDFRKACVAKLSILDLASFRVDGRVCVDTGQQAPAALLPGQRMIYQSRVASAERVLGGANQNVEAPLINDDLALTFGGEPVFRHIRVGAFKGREKRQQGKQRIDIPERVTWHLRRAGRIRMPYAAWLLDQLLGDMSRQAFDIDF